MVFLIFFFLTPSKERARNAITFDHAKGTSEQAKR